jgi:hypothetical protein
MLLADRGFDAGWIRALVSQHGAWANIPPERNRTESVCFSPYLYRTRNLKQISMAFEHHAVVQLASTSPRRKLWGGGVG